MYIAYKFVFQLQICRILSFLFIPRELSPELIRLRKLYPIVVLTGPRQSGKTTLCKHLFKSFKYYNLEDISLRELIRESPKAFLESNKAGAIIDEVHNFPELFSYLQVVVDEHPKSKFILTGSSNFKLLEQVTQSLAGRAATLTLLPFSLSELNTQSKIDTNRLILNGGYPVVWGKGIPVQDASRNYYNTYVERDVRQILNIKDVTKFATFVRLCAGRTGAIVNASALSNEVGVSVHTIQDWLSVLEASYILFRLPPFYKNIGKRLIKAPKMYFYDTGLACFLMGIENENQLAVHPLRGALFENLVVMEFLKRRLNKGKQPNLYFYRDQSQREIDLLQEEGAAINAFEIKSAQVFQKGFFKNLDYLTKILGKMAGSTQLIYDGEAEINTTENGVVNFRNLPI